MANNLWLFSLNTWLRLLKDPAVLMLCSFGQQVAAKMAASWEHRLFVLWIGSRYRQVEKQLNHHKERVQWHIALCIHKNGSSKERKGSHVYTENNEHNNHSLSESTFTALHSCTPAFLYSNPLFILSLLLLILLLVSTIGLIIVLVVVEVKQMFNSRISAECSSI